jgi:DNA-directed RNA polymerase subunit K
MEKYTKYEIARILGARALQIAMNAPLLLDIKKEKLEELNYDPLKIAEMEFNSAVLPITVRRPMPQKEEVGEEAEKEEEIEIVGEEEVKPEEKKEEKAAEPVEEVAPEEEAEEEPEVEPASEEA